MARVVASSWEEVGSRDETGPIVNISYTCPKCNMNTGNIILISARGLNKIDSGFETDQDCEICGKSLTIECR